MVVKLAVDGGHGLYTPGKRTPDGEREWTFNNIVLTAFIKELNNYEGILIKRLDDPTGKRDIPLAERTNSANAWGADYYMSFHHNANTSKWGTWTGVETFIAPNASATSVALANAIHPALVKGYGLKDRGIKRKDLHIVRETKMPAILIEGGFMDSTIDIKVLLNKAMLENAGKLMAQAFAKFTKLKRKSVPSVGIVKPKEEEIVLNDTGRKEALDMIEKGVKEGIFSGKHENRHKYTDGELISYAFAYINRKFKAIDKKLD